MGESTSKPGIVLLLSVGGGDATFMLAACVKKCSSRMSSLYRTVICMSCSPYIGSPSKESGMLNGTGELVSISSINWVWGDMFEVPSGSNVTNPNSASSFPSLIISPITIIVSDMVIVSIP